MLGSRYECTEQSSRLTFVGLVAVIAGLVREHFGEGVVQVPHGAFAVMLEGGRLPAVKNTLSVVLAHDATLHDVFDGVESLRIGNLLTSQRCAVSL